MESLRRKRKGVKASAAIGSHLSDNGDHGRKSKKKCKLESCDDKRGILMTAPPSTSSSPLSPNRGHKRKLGCIDSSTQIRRKKKIENEYVLGASIGQGKFGSVRLCRSKVTGKEFAVKSLKKNGEESVHREVEIMQHLSGHPNVVMLRSVFEDSENFHLVMELCKEGRLLDKMKEGRFSEQRAACLVKDLVGVIKYCHEMGVVHRDIKPENILMMADGAIKLADFGLAVRLASGQKLSGIAGSPAYVAPEVLTGHYSEKVDIWGAGVLLHALLVGVLPFQGDSLEAVFEAIKTVELDFHSGLWEPISDLARDLIGRMLTRDVSKRITPDEILRHPWILLYTESKSKALPSKSKTRSSAIVQRLNFAALSITKSSSSSSSSSFGSSGDKSEEQDEYGFVDALAAAISRVQISEPKRSRLCLQLTGTAGMAHLHEGQPLYSFLTQNLTWCKASISDESIDISSNKRCRWWLIILVAPKGS
ncbi:uncharacterized protein A4U43_C03F3430 [Asparagus officinalis]|uniref:Protein kinase domain-containing protein n=1 Tax=Asparagus officinalis TaxID=4686 RepID=A0A5P1F704_ASPOF|nr:serine/threonine-protein kinase PEPKR2 [Asparagus officinalis]ONK74165.1 uncharacterized protein A4U43_C03F3430 [Asparagus officinalis]